MWQLLQLTLGAVYELQPNLYACVTVAIHMGMWCVCVSVCAVFIVVLVLLSALQVNATCSDVYAITCQCMNIYICMYVYFDMLVYVCLCLYICSCVWPLSNGENVKQQLQIFCFFSIVTPPAVQLASSLCLRVFAASFISFMRCLHAYICVHIRISVFRIRTVNLLARLHTAC